MNWSRITQTCELTLVCDVLFFYLKKTTLKCVTKIVLFCMYLGPTMERIQ